MSMLISNLLGQINSWLQNFSTYEPHFFSRKQMKRKLNFLFIVRTVIWASSRTPAVPKRCRRRRCEFVQQDSHPKNYDHTKTQVIKVCTNHNSIFCTAVKKSDNIFSLRFLSLVLSLINGVLNVNNDNILLFLSESILIFKLGGDVPLLLSPFVDVPRPSIYRPDTWHPSFGQHWFPERNETGNKTMSAIRTRSSSACWRCCQNWIMLTIKTVWLCIAANLISCTNSLSTRYYNNQ